MVIAAREKSSAILLQPFAERNKDFLSIIDEYQDIMRGETRGHIREKW